ncbi:MAG: hypothetical protein AB8G17_16525 [Gammaproteobacteria bacterium]
MTISVPAFGANIVIGGLDDLDFGRVTPTSGTVRQSTRVCVAVDDPGRYSLVATGDGPGGQFLLDGGIALLPFRAFFSDTADRRGRELRTAQPLRNLRAKRIEGNRGCQRRNSRLTVLFDGSDLQAMPSGSYRGTLTLMVTPE